MKRKIYQHPFLIMSGLYIGAFVGMYSETSLNIALPALSETFGLPISTIQLLVVGYMMIIGIVLPFASLLMKTFKVKTLTLFSLTSFFIGSILSAAAPNFGLLFINWTYDSRDWYRINFTDSPCFDDGSLPYSKIRCCDGNGRINHYVCACCGPYFSGNFIKYCFMAFDFC